MESRVHRYADHTHRPGASEARIRGCSSPRPRGCRRRGYVLGDASFKKEVHQGHGDCEAATVQYFSFYSHTLAGVSKTLLPRSGLMWKISMGRRFCQGGIASYMTSFLVTRFRVPIYEGRAPMGGGGEIRYTRIDYGSGRKRLVSR